MKKRNEELKNTTYELFIAALSILSIVNLALILVAPNALAGQVAVIVDGFLTVIFIIDFVYRLSTAESKSGYFFRQFGWADLLASLPLPQFKVLRLFRIFRAGRLMRAFGIRNIIRVFLKDRAGSALLTLLFFIILVLEFGAMAMVEVESRSPSANITTATDAIWYTYVTITTVGYGDTYPVTNPGRLIGMVIMAVGVGLFGTLTGYLANAFLAPKQEETPAEEVLAPSAGEAKAKLAELKQLLAEQKQAQANLESKIAEIEMLLCSE